MKGDKQIYYYKIKKHYKYRLARSFSGYINVKGYSIHTTYIHLEEDGFLYVKKEYCWDGASGPAIDTITFMRPSLVHDVLYQLIMDGLLPARFRSYADDLLKEMCLEDKMNPLRAGWVHWTVRNLGKFYIKITGGNMKVMYCAPKKSNKEGSK